MGTQITFRRGSSFPTQGSGITLSEPVFETTLHTFHIGLGYGVTAEWVGAPISGLSVDIAAGITYKIPSTAAVKNYIDGLCYGNTAAPTITQYVSSFNGRTGAIQGVSAAVAGTGIFVSGATGSVTITNVGVQSFNGLTGAVQGVSSWNGQTGAVSFVNYVTSFNGVTGAVGGVTTSVANTFTVLQSFNSGISAAGATLSANTRIPAGATLTVDGNIVANGNVSLGNATSDTITSAADIKVNNLTVGRGSGGVSTNTAVGVNALFSNSTGSLNAAIGNLALTANTTGGSNVAVGDGALNANTTGSLNTAFGRRALLVNNGSSNTAAGNGSLSTLTAGSFNTAIGRLSGSSVITATGGIYIGYFNVGTDSSTNEIVIGTQTTGFGSNTAVIGANTQTAAYIYGLVNAMGGVSAAGATFSNINIRGTGRIQAGISETLYLGAAGVTEIEVNNDENAIRLWANGTQAIECFDTSTSVYTDFFVSSKMTVYAGISAAGGVTFANNVQAAKIEADSVYSSTTNLALFNMGIV